MKASPSNKPQKNQSPQKHPSSETQKAKPTYHLNLPRTGFDMRGHLPEKEPILLKFWQSLGVEKKRHNARKDAPTFTLHDGPPYANGHLHLGHAVNKVAKDMVGRLQWAKGFATPYVPGWDCHGLPIEAKVLETFEKKGHTKNSLDPLAFRKACGDFAEKWITIQRSEFQRLGVLGFETPHYTTMQRPSEVAILKGFFDLVQQGLVYLGLKPVLWSVVEETALAEAEVEYKDVTSPSLYVSFPIVPSAESKAQNLEGVSALIWTTTPWTLPANRAIAYGKLDYVVFKAKEHLFLAAKDCLPHIQKETGLEEISVIKQLSWQDLAGIICNHPLHGKGYDFNVPLVAADHVKSDTGTGLVHTAPAHGVDDFSLAKPFNLEVTDLINGQGLFRPNVPLFAGTHIYKAEKPVVEALTEAGHLFFKGALKHSYPHSWRSRTPLIYRATPQWFLGLDTPPTDQKHTLRQKALDALKNVAFFPESGRNRLHAMVEGRADWCLSRQRVWGIPLMLFVHKTSRQLLNEPTIFKALLNLVSEKGTDVWWQLDADEFLAPFGFGGYEKVMDILDVWFESGMTHRFVLENASAHPAHTSEKASHQAPNPLCQADLYLEGSDQHRGWFQSSLVLGAGLQDAAPYKTLLTHGFVVDDKGYKMSKSLGNVVAPGDVIQKQGADLLRLWVASNHLYDDLRIGPQALSSAQDIYRRLRNTLRFLLGNLADLPPFFVGQSDQNKPEAKEPPKLPLLEQWLLARLYAVHTQLEQASKRYDFSQMIGLIHHFCNQDLSAYYFDIRKDALYCDSPLSDQRRAIIHTLNHVTSALLTWLAPFLPFTAEEAYQCLLADTLTASPNAMAHSPGQKPAEKFEALLAERWGDHTKAPPSIHLLPHYAPPKAFANQSLEHRFKGLFGLRAAITSALEQKRAAGHLKSSLEACPTLWLEGEALWHMANDYGEQNLAELVLTSGLKIEKVTAAHQPPERAFQADLRPTGLADWLLEDAPQEKTSLSLKNTGVWVEVNKAPGAKCQRCWRFEPKLIKAICDRCDLAENTFTKNPHAQKESLA